MSEGIRKWAYIEEESARERHGAMGEKREIGGIEHQQAAREDGEGRGKERVTPTRPRCEPTEEQTRPDTIAARDQTGGVPA